MAKETRGRKKKWDVATSTFTVRFPVDLIKWLEKEAKAAGKNRNEYLVELMLKTREAREAGEDREMRKIEDKKVKFSDEILEMFETMAAEHKGKLRKIINDLLKAAHASGAHLSLTEEPEGYMEWIDSLIEARKKAEEDEENS